MNTLIENLFKENQNLKEEQNLTKAKKYQFAKNIVKCLIDNEMWNDSINLYVNDECWTPDGKFNDEYDWVPNGKGYKVEQGVDPRMYFDYVNPNGISLSFENDLYNDVNYGSMRVYDKLQDIASKYGQHFEIGNAWNMSSYDD